MTLFAILILLTCWNVPVWAEGGSNRPWEVWDYKTSPARGGVFRTAWPVDVGVLNPNHAPVNNWYVISDIYEKLLTTDGKDRPVPWLAESWSFPNELTCIMKLRKGIKFHDGAAFNAEAVKFMQEWNLDPKNESLSISYLQPLKSVEILDEYTIQWQFREPWGSFLGVMASAPGFMISPKVLRESPKKADSRPVGTGPFIFDDRNPGHWIRLKRNPSWWFGRGVGHPEMPYFDGLLTTVIPDPSVAFATLKAGKVDRVSLNKSLFGSAKNDPMIQAHALFWNMLRGYRFNHSIPPFNDIRARQAVAYAIDRKALVEGTEFGMGRIASCLFPGDHWAHNPNLKPWPFDRQKAIQLLTEAGFPHGVTITGYVTNNRFSNIVRGEAVQNMLAEVGIHWKMDVLDPAAARKRAVTGRDHFTIGDYETIYDPDIIATNFYHPAVGQNGSRNNALINLVERGRKEIDLDRRQKIYFELERVLYENCEDIWLFWEVGPIAFQRNVRGFDPEMVQKHKRVWEISHPLWFKEGKP